MSGFNFSDDEVSKLAREAVDETGAEFQREMDAVHRSHAGQPVEVVLPVMREVFSRIDVEASDDEIIDYAEVIARGDRIKVEGVDPV